MTSLGRSIVGFGVRRTLVGILVGWRVSGVIVSEREPRRRALSTRRVTGPTACAGQPVSGGCFPAATLATDRCRNRGGCQAAMAGRFRDDPRHPA